MVAGQARIGAMALKSLLLTPTSNHAPAVTISKRLPRRMGVVRLRNPTAYNPTGVRATSALAR